MTRRRTVLFVSLFAAQIAYTRLDQACQRATLHEFLYTHHILLTESGSTRSMTPPSTPNIQGAMNTQMSDINRDITKAIMKDKAAAIKATSKSSSQSGEAGGEGDSDDD